ncbi:hypothetical protein BaRGS_00017983 [Batillaria attramentaria]|uniref:Uncharacterized protein n=1 Tax=Batillaria attramentaria TaxID=370345 RepID=A0ABD0KU80_9CAEN
MINLNRQFGRRRESSASCCAGSNWMQTLSVMEQQTAKEQAFQLTLRSPTVGDCRRNALQPFPTNLTHPPAIFHSVYSWTPCISKRVYWFHPSPYTTLMCLQQ